MFGCMSYLDMATPKKPFCSLTSEGYTSQNTGITTFLLSFTHSRISATSSRFQELQEKFLEKITIKDLDCLMADRSTASLGEVLMLSL
ncbi:hypothetical protein HanIR_Chr16g0793141 [Helianthus annuus]|nr:hypothetical protein HanIR_Chr16g0793141 [Helianthus annuus]